jgi:hypothetical protein
LELEWTVLRYVHEINFLPSTNDCDAQVDNQIPLANADKKGGSFLQRRSLDDRKSSRAENSDSAQLTGAGSSLTPPDVGRITTRQARSSKAPSSLSTEENDRDDEEQEKDDEGTDGEDNVSQQDLSDSQGETQGGREWAIRRILDHKPWQATRSRATQYKVEWESSWQVREMFTGSRGKTALDDYWDGKKNEKRKKESKGCKAKDR